jgi:ABC-type multidrug transport system fused ATPase/permease subunit
MNLLTLNELIPEKEQPEECKIKAGEIEFKNVSFTYDQKLSKEDQIEVISNLSFKVKSG